MHRRTAGKYYQETRQGTQKGRRARQEGKHFCGLFDGLAYIVFPVMVAKIPLVPLQMAGFKVSGWRVWRFGLQSGRLPVLEKFLLITLQKIPVRKLFT